MNNCIICSKSFAPVYRHPHQSVCSSACRKHYKQNWAKENKDAVSNSKQKWLDNNPDKRKEASSSFMKRNRPYYTQYASLRTRKVQLAQPSWVDKEALLDVYKEADYLGLEVDHIIPITHKLVCGLHVWDNLQLLTRSENATKSNKYEVC